ncbi:MAG: hypothetical protein ABSA40_08935 [Candidatus Dormibacteria bacterium]|jgi:hypothetical protein
MPEPPTPAPPPPLPDRIDPASLSRLDAARLDAEAARLGGVERATRSAMSPYERHLREIRTRLEEIATERRRRERTERHARRMSVREQAASGEMPGLDDALGGDPPPLPDATQLSQVRAHLRTGGEVAFGYPSRPGVVSFTDGRQMRSATTWGEARQLYADGWEPGSPGNPGVRGVRVHLIGTRVERVVDIGDVVVAAG